MSALDLDAIRAAHFNEDGACGVCLDLLDPRAAPEWPCEVIRLCDEVERLRQALRVIAGLPTRDDLLTDARSKFLFDRVHLLLGDAPVFLTERGGDDRERRRG